MTIAANPVSDNPVSAQPTTTTSSKPPPTRQSAAKADAIARPEPR
jgi:hypothetical protein